MAFSEELSKLAGILEKISPEELKKIKERIKNDEIGDVERAQLMRKVFVSCPAHGQSIHKVGIKEINIFNETYKFFNLECERFEYCNVDVSNDPKLLKLLDTKTPLSRETFDETPEPDLKKASITTYNYCPYCGERGGISYVYKHIPSFFFPKTLQMYKMKCGHDFAIIFNIS